MKINKLLALALVSTLSISTVGCASSSKTNGNDHSSEKSHDHSSHNHGSSENHDFKKITGEELQKIQLDDKEKEKYLVIDTRPAATYAEGHLKHAINIPFKEFKENIAKLDEYKDRAIILYCHASGMSVQAATMLKEAGFNNLTVAPGVTEYKEYQFVKYSNITGGDFQGIIYGKESAVYLDARDTKDYDESHVSGAISVNFKELDNIASKLPEDKNMKIYTYCYSGNRSGVVAQKLVDLGYTNVTNVLDGTKEFQYRF